MAASSDLRAFPKLTRAWALGILRDRATVFWTFALPILFVVIFGFAFGRSSVGSYRVALVADENTPAGRALSEGFKNVKPFKVSGGALDDELKKLRDADLDAVVEVPAGTAAAGSPTALNVYYDPSRGSAQQIVLPIIRQVVDGVDLRLSGRPQLLTIQEQSVRSQDLQYIDFFLPGIIAFSIMQAGMFSAIPFVQLRVTRVLKRLGATPLSRWVVIATQSLVRLIIAAIQTVVLLTLGKVLFGVHISSNVLGMAVFVLLGGLAFLCIGFAVSGLAKTEEAVPALVQSVSFPMMFLSGVFFPVDNFPTVIQSIARVLPLTFLGDGLRQVMVGGAALNPLWVDFTVLLGWVAVAGLAAVRLFKWE